MELDIDSFEQVGGSMKGARRIKFVKNVCESIDKAKDLERDSGCSLHYDDILKVLISVYNLGYGKQEA